MESRRWTNQGQPQMLQIAVFLLYINAGLSVFAMVRFGVFPLLVLAAAAGNVAAGYGIANEKKWGYVLGVAVAVLPLLLRVVFGGVGVVGGDLLTLLFEIALVALLLHPQSRDYQRIWFK